MRFALPALLLMLLAACAGTPRQPAPRTASAEAPAEVLPAAAPRPAPPAAAAADGPPTEPPPADLAQRPDPEPRVEPVRPGGPNKPYQVAGQAYTPERGDPATAERGIASWYGRAFHGRRTASGETYDMYAMSAAHKTMPIPSYARVRNPANGREVIVRVNDRGPFVAGRIIDLSYAAAQKLGVRGVAPVEVERITHEAIRSGAWRRGDSVLARADAAAPAAPRAAPPATTPATTSATTPTSAPAPTPAAAPAPQPAVVVAVAAAEPATPVPTPPNPAPTQPQPAYTEPARGFWLQLGAFAQHGGAQEFRRRVEGLAGWLGPLLAVFEDKGLHRLQAGPFANRGEAQGALERLRAELQLVPVVLQRR